MKGPSPRPTFALTLVPPDCESQTPRDIVFLLDRSGSMSGWKMAAARRGISRLVDSLGSHDRFQVVAFDDRIETPNQGWVTKLCGKLVSQSIQLVDATDANRYEAVRWLSQIESRGGTEMGMALTHALRPFLEPHNNRSSAIVLVTDGQITGEDSVLRLLGTVPAESRPRLFCLGVDTAVNAGVLQRLTKFTGGIFELVESETRLDEVMYRFGKEMGAPSLTNLEVESLDHQCQISQLAPCNLTTLYSGRPVAIYGRVESGQPVRLAVRGKLADGSDWTTALTATEMPADEASVDVLLASWGRARLRQMEDEHCAASSTNDLLKNAIIQCSLETNVLSRFTAFVAVDESERVNPNGQPHSVIQPVELPQGWRPASMPLIARDQLMPLRRKQTITSTVVRTATTPSTSVSSTKLAELALQKGLVGLDQLSEAQSLSQSAGISVNDALVKLQYMTGDEAAKLLAELHSMHYVDLSSQQISEQIIELIPESVARENTVLPISRVNGVLTVAISDPSDFETIEKLRFILNCNVETMIASSDSIHVAINRYYGQVEGESADCLLQEFTDTAIDFSESDCLVIGNNMAATYDDAQDDDVADMATGDYASFAFAPAAPSQIRALKRRSMAADAKVTLSHSSSEAPVVRLVSLLISEAVSLRASHVILTPTPNALDVSYVIDGVLVSRDAVPRVMLSAIVARLKILASMDISNRDPLQSGMLSITVGNQSLQLQVHFAMTKHGVSVLIEMQSGRIGDPANCDSANQPQCVRDWWQAAVAAT